MKNQELAKRIQTEILDFICSRKSLQLSSITTEGQPYASYAPFALGESCLYVLVSEIAVHAVNLQKNPTASILIIEDEDAAGELFARKRVNYSVKSLKLENASEEWLKGVNILVERHGDRINKLSELEDFKLFKLTPTAGRYVKGFGRAYAFKGEALVGEFIEHLRDGHKKRDAA
jgi:putative heme iron utilization protein